MTLDDLPTPCLVLDLGILKANLARMQAAVDRHPGLRLRPHMKTAKSIPVADLAAPGKGPITVSTVAEARYFAGGGFHDQIYAVGVTPAKLDAIAALNAQGADVKVITDDIDVAAAIAAHAQSGPAAPLQGEVLEAEGEEVLHRGLDAHRGQRARRALELQARLIEVWLLICSTEGRGLSESRPAISRGSSTRSSRPSPPAPGSVSPLRSRSSARTGAS